MANMSSSIEDHVVRLDSFGRCPPAHLTAALHTNRPFVEVSKSQFFAAIGPLDIVSSAQGDARTGYSRFTTRQNTEVGRSYSDGTGLPPTRFVLTAAFAEKRSDVLAAH